MIEFLTGWYFWLKAMHIMSVIAWMAGLFYLPRLFVYHAEQVGQGPAHALFVTMETKLLRVIMNPAMVSTWVFGLLLFSIPGVVNWGQPWAWVKLAGILGMTWFHMWLAARRRDFELQRNQLSGRRYRMMNELPTLFMVAIVISVVVKF